jgi:FAD/FMN-containing dehydrogenase
MKQAGGETAVETLARCCPGLDVRTDGPVLASHGTDWTAFHAPAPAAVAFPRDCAEVSDLVAVAGEHRIPLVPSGGRTGLSGGAVAARGEVVVSFDRMQRIVAFDPVDRTVTVEAGVVTATVQEYAAARGLHYPVSFAAEGSSQIGGNIATNAGGIRVLRYGLTRDRVAGLKVVDGRGRLLEFNAALVKNASGYDLRHLMIGSEGTLGLIVEATLWLIDPPPPARVMLLGARSLDAVMKILQSARGKLAMSAFEFMSSSAVARVCAARGLSPPLAQAPPFYALLEFDCPAGAEEDAEAVALEIYEAGMRAGAITDGVVSRSEAQAAALWRYREGISEAASDFTPYKNDLSVRLSRMPEFLAALETLVEQLFPGFEVLWYGHLGDGNLHMNILRPADMDLQVFQRTCAGLSEQLFEVTRTFGGSVSAEHGIGLLKQPYLGYSRSPAEIELLRGIKGVFDPAGILNPGKLLDVG